MMAVGATFEGKSIVYIYIYIYYSAVFRPAARSVREEITVLWLAQAEFVRKKHYFFDNDNVKGISISFGS